ncbi:alpha/beta fold hydrolase [Paenibacillus sp. 1P07SE]|uniref:alpha/beta fold hydrolase n=1 Tax=Paenibacillus sp. 1P07SE TaxID=3132209 RepID=UPI0039A71CAC
MPYETINGIEMYYESKGEGMPIVFIHPPLLTGAVFRYQQSSLSPSYRVITFDIRGHGKSSPSETPLTYGLIVEDMKQLMNKLQIEKVIVAGYSTGGSIALEAMLTYPDLFVGGVLISAMSETSDIYLRNRIRIAVGLSSWRPSERLLRWGIAWGNSDSRTTFRTLRSDARRGSRRNIRQLYAYSLQYRCTERLPEIQAPVLLLYGGKDRNFKRYRTILRHGLPHSQLVVIGSAKHQLPTKAALQTNDVIRRWVAKIVKEANLGVIHAPESEADVTAVHITESDPSVLDQENRASP